MAEYTTREKRDDEVECWGFGTGAVDPFKKASRKAAEYITKMEGFLAVHLPDTWHTLWIFDSENNAKKAKNLAEAKGIKCGREIAKIYVEKRYLEKKP